MSNNPFKKVHVQVLRTTFIEKCAIDLIHLNPFSKRRTSFWARKADVSVVKRKENSLIIRYFFRRG